jgi:hypothetical protein
MKNKNIVRYKYEDAIRMTNLSDVGNALLFFVFCIGGLSIISSSFHAQICGLTALLFFVIKQNYDWRNVSLNWLLVGLYLTLFIIEVIKAGIPDMQLDNSFGKGILLNVFIGMAPEIYICLRLLFVIPLVKIIFIEKPTVFGTKS